MEEETVDFSEKRGACEDTQVFQAEYAGIPVGYRFRYPLTRMFFWDRMKPADAGTPFIEVSEDTIEKGREQFPEDTPPEHIEFKALIDLTSRVLLSSAPVCVFHAVAVSAFGKAWLITAPSGVGKTTQLKNWRLMKDVPEVGVISGDMPVLERLTDGSVLVHPSPWNGKEGYRGAAAAPLGGIVCLERIDPRDDNAIRLLDPSERIARCLGQFVCRPENETQIRNYARLADAVLGGVPVWLLRNRGDAESTALMIKTIEQYAAKCSLRPAEAAESFFGTSAVSEPADAQNALCGLSAASGGARYRRTDGIFLHEICGEYLLLAGAEARRCVPFMSSVNEPSAIIWEYISAPRSAAECAAVLAAEYPDVDPGRLCADASVFLSEMEKKGYVRKV
ncbi:MAG: PqqD family peptide modification chaperone [Clostridiales bacterium]|nr:PqqD family peptide modification chaperone [Clostridiales bacterium]